MIPAALRGRGPFVGRSGDASWDDDRVTLSTRALRVEDAGEVLTLQRAAYVPEARRYRDPELPPLTQTLDEVRAELARTDVVGLAVRDDGRLVASVRLRIDGAVAHLGRLVVAPDRQGEGIGTDLLTACERVLPPEVVEIRLFTGSRSEATIRLYERAGYVRQYETPAGRYDLVHLAKHV